MTFHLFTFLINNAKYLVVLFDPFYGPHTTDRMQPLDVAVYGPIKKYFEQELNTFQKTHPGRLLKTSTIWQTIWRSVCQKCVGSECS